ncbi:MULTISPECIES: NAD(P)-dependent oxidoreductase [unclassified Streptomyces]|uniref:NAD(P)-dependent oxidoreductase n=1 Tax=unclassified Streptomyces TaxID=2593676 RepID=UPI002E29107A|nr:NAD(P)H-binding protein [Streptomyces sp. NBC_00306]
MKLTVFGATGGVGHEIVRQALASGHQVTAVVRDAARLTVDDPALRVVTAGLNDPEALRPAVAGRDAVLSGVGARAIKHAGVATTCTRTILRALEAEGVRRFLAVSAAPIGPVPPDETLLLRAVTPLISRVYRNVYADLTTMEDEIRRSTTDWTVVRPPKLTNKPMTGVYRTALGANLRGGNAIGRADVAHAMLRMTDDASTLKQAVGIAY